MIHLSRQDRDALTNAFAWFASLDPQPFAIASLRRRVAGALHFIYGETSDVEFPGDAVVVVRPSGARPPVRCVEIAEPRREFARMTRVLREIRQIEDIRPTASGALISASARIGADCRIEAGAIVGPGVEIGEGCTIESGAVIRSGVCLGPGCRVLATAVVGSDGYGYAFPQEQLPEAIAHLGGVEVGAEVDIGAGAIVSAGTIDPTVIGRGTKVDGHVYIGHNAEIGEGSMICAKAVIGGSAWVGSGVWINPAALIKTKVAVGEGAVVGMGAVVMKPVPAGTTVMGDRAQEVRERLRREAALDRLLAKRQNAGR